MTVVIAGEATQLIHRPAKDIYDFVLDLDSYKKADTKIAEVFSVRWSGDQVEILYRGVLRGIPSPPAVQIATVQPGRRIDVRSKPGTLAHWMVGFHGVFTFEELAGGATRVFHREEFTFRAPFKWIAEPYLAAWLAEDTRQEMVRMKALLEGTAQASRSSG